jgi:two-component system, sensor histidine kinase and response regulator
MELVMHDTDPGREWTPAAMLERLGGDEELARQLVELFIAECPRMMAAVRESVESVDAEQVRRAAHAFKGSVGNFTDGAPMTTAFELEQIGRLGGLDQAPGLLARLEREVEVFIAALRRFEAGQFEEGRP